ncbi:MAG: hypothetical protein JW864_04915 [Spirochaetes bacterium]|nr:hypothetical protein [Spirochaetota bacterium]
MDSTHIWYLTDNSQGKGTAGKIAEMGLNVNIVGKKSTIKESINTDNINVFIYDYINSDIMKVVSMIQKDERTHDAQKFIFVQKKNLKEALNTAMVFPHTEILSRPLDERIFLLLLEKTVIIERFREVMGDISREAGARIGTYENIMDINRQDLFVSDMEKKNFSNIIKFEKDLIKKQVELNKSIREYTFLRQRDMFYDENRIRAEVRLNELESRDLDDAIRALSISSPSDNPESVYVNNFIESNHNVLGENNQFSDTENGKLQKELADLKEKNKLHLARISELKEENNQLKTAKKKTAGKRK